MNNKKKIIIFLIIGLICGLLSIIVFKLNRKEKKLYSWTLKLESKNLEKVSNINKDSIIWDNELKAGTLGNYIINFDYSKVKSPFSYEIVIDKSIKDTFLSVISVNDNLNISNNFKGIVSQEKIDSQKPEIVKIRVSYKMRDDHYDFLDRKGTEFKIPIKVIIKEYHSKYLKDLILLNEGYDSIDKAKESIIKKGNPDFLQASLTNDGLYQSNDKYGESYYFRGTAPNNFVRFGKNNKDQDLYWRIVRINGDGSVRLIYNGTSTKVEYNDVEIAKSPFNIKENDIKYFSYKFGDKFDEDNYDSTIKKLIDNWFIDNLLEEYNYLADSDFCVDRSSAPCPKTWFDKERVCFGGPYRVHNLKKPSFLCPRENDIFNVRNGKLKYPIALLTVDEAMFAGASGEPHFTPNNKYYLYTKNWTWLMSPSDFNPKVGYPYINTIFFDGTLGWMYTSFPMVGVRPVINLKSDVRVSEGIGTSFDPYIIEW